MRSRPSGRRRKAFLYENLYFSRQLDSEKDAAERVITELFEHWVAHPDALPATHREKARQEPLPRVVCDYIAGMTDNFILSQHEKMLAKTLGLHRGGSVFQRDRLLEVIHGEPQPGLKVHLRLPTK